MSDLQKQEPAATSQPPAAVRLLFVLDITGSMGGELEACKGAMKGLVALCSDPAQDLPCAFSFAVITFTEDDTTGCHTSLFESTSAQAAQEYMQGIRLCVPPEAPTLTASGDDGEENQKAALARTTNLDPAIPTVAFFITDAPPHLKAQAHQGARTAEHEYNHLIATYPELSPEDARDFFRTCHITMLAHFDGSLVLNCVVFDDSWRSTRADMSSQIPSPSETQLLYGSLAKQTGGLLMSPQSRDAEKLASGLVTIVKALVGRLLRANAQQQQQQQLPVPDLEAAQDAEGGGGGGFDPALQGFRLIDLSGVNADRACEEDDGGSACYGDVNKIFSIAMDRMVEVCGKKWSKRAIGVSAPLEQLQFVWRAARYLALCAKPTPTEPAAAATSEQGKAAELDHLMLLHAAVLEKLPAGKRGHFNITEEDLKQMGAEAAAWAAAGGVSTTSPAVSAISLASVGEALEDDAVWEDWLHSVMNLLLGYPIHIQLPLDAYGNSDFMDAWSAVLIRMGVDTLSASEFMQLIESEPSVTGLTDKREYNAFLVLADPADKLASLVLKVASSTQTLDYITSVAMGGSKGFLPNLHAGITSACLMDHLSRPTALSEFQWKQVQQMAHTLRIRKANAAKGVTAQLRKGTANPEDNVSKLLLALLRLQDATNAIMPSPPSDNADAAADNNLLQQEAALGSVLQEWLGSMMQRFYRKQTPENNSRYLQELMTYVPPDMVFRTLSPGGLEGQEAPLNPLRQLHPLETQDVISLMQTKADVNNSAAASELPACINSDWQAGVVSLLLGERPGVGPHPVLNRFVLAAGRLLALLLPPASAAGPAAGKAIKDTVAVPSDAADGSSKAARSILEQLPGPSAALETCWPSWKQSALEALLLRFRTGRYRSSMPAQSDAPQAIGSDMMVVNGVVRPAATSTKCEWVAVPVQSCLVLALQRLQDALSGELQGLKQKRLNEVKEQLLISTALLMKQHAGDADEACRSLKQLKLQLDVPSADQPSSKAPGPQAEHKHGAVATLLGHTCTLKRTDVPLVLQQIGALPGLPTAAGEQEVVLKVGEVTPQMLHALVLGDWSRQRPQVCRRSLLVKQLCQHFGSDCSDVEAAMQAEEVCCRPKVCNRHGHTAELPYPGPAGWTEAYAAARMAAVKSRRPGMVKKVQKKLQAMEKFTQMATEAKAAAAGDAAKLAAVCEVLASTHDPRFIDRIMSQVNQILQRA